jgi:hypothetical protein
MWLINTVVHSHPDAAAAEPASHLLPRLAPVFMYWLQQRAVLHTIFLRSLACAALVQCQALLSMGAADCPDQTRARALQYEQETVQSMQIK